MTDIFHQLIEFFEEDGWDFQETEGMTILSMGFAGLHGKWLCYAQAREKEEQFVFEYRPTQAAAKLITFERRGFAGRQLKEVPGIEGVVTEELKQFAVKFSAAGPRSYVDDSP